MLLFDRLAVYALNELLPGPLEEILIRYVQILFPSQNQTEETRNKAARAAAALAPCAHASSRLKDSMQRHILAARLSEPSSFVQQELDRAKKTLEG